MKLYAVSDGPPSLAVRMALKALNVPFELVSVNFNAGEHLTDDYAKLNPQKEIPVLDDNGFYLSEHVAIMQYICDKYGPDSPFYPKDPKHRALVNQRLNFNLAFFYPSISRYVMAPIFFDYPRSAGGLKKLHNSLEVFEEYMKREDKKFVAGDTATIADFPLVTSVMCLEAIGFPFDKFTRIKAWYENFKATHSDLWKIAEVGMKEIAEFEKNPPDLSAMNHPFHPVRKVTK